MAAAVQEHLVTLAVDGTIWERVFTVAPLVIVGTREADGSYDLAPKHLATPLSWAAHFGFVCTPAHATYQNIKREGVFTVSYPRPTQIVLTSLTAAPREPDGSKATLDALPTFPAPRIDGRFITDAYFFLECELDRIIDGFAENSLIVGRIVGAYAHADSLRGADVDDNDLLAEAPLLAYLNWGRFARIRESYAFPFMRGFKR